MSIFTNCGQYLPGQRPIDPGPRDIIDPRGPCGVCIPPPDGIVTPWGGKPAFQFKYKCVEIGRSFCPPPFESVLAGIGRMCFRCDGIGGNPRPDDPACTFLSLPSCRASCSSVFFPCPTPTRYKCVTISTDYCPSPYSNKVRTVRKNCYPCDGAFNPSLPGGANPQSGDPGCVYLTNQECITDCRDENYTCPLGGVLPPSPGGGGAGPTTGGKYVCRIIERPSCPPTTGPFRMTGEIIKRTCIACTRGPNNTWIAPTSYGPPGALSAFPPQVFDMNCRDISACKPNCISTNTCSAVPLDQYGGINPGSVTEPGGTVIQIPGERPVMTTSQFPNERPGGGGGGGGGVTTQFPMERNVVSVPGSYSQVIKNFTNNTANVVNINIESQFANSQNKIVPLKIGGENSLYHSKYNFFSLNEKDITQESKLVSNYYYPNIFAKLVVEEIFYVLSRIGTNQPYNELVLQSITTEKIAISLNPLLLQSFLAIHDASNQKVDPNAFFRTVRKHLLTGTLDEFDPDFYIALAEKQKNDLIKVYSNTLQPQELLEKYALSLINNSEVKADIEDKTEYQAAKLRRSKRLNVDINARTCFTDLCGDSTEITIGNAGLNVTKFTNPALDSTVEDVVMPNGDGYGYYLYLNTSKNNCMAFQYDTDVSAATYISPATRYEALSVMGKDPAIKITVESLSGSHEFTSGVEYTADFTPMYFKLELSSVSSTQSDNPIIDNISAIYTRLTDQNEIDEHCDSNGLNVSRLNISYKDPIFRYIKDSGKINYTQLDINFKNTGKNRGLANQSILTTNISFGLIITPVKGSRFNPFNTYSKVESFSNDKVIRTIRFIPSINVSDNERQDPELESVYIYDEKNDFRIGVAEPIDTQAITYRFNSNSEKLTNTFFDSNTKTYTPPTESIVPDIGQAYLIKQSLDYLIQNYQGKESFTWYDVFRRLPMTKFSELLFEENQGLANQLSYGLRNGIKINTVLNRAESDLDEIMPDDEKVIIREIDR